MKITEADCSIRQRDHPHITRKPPYEHRITCFAGLIERLGDFLIYRAAARCSCGAADLCITKRKA